jgi:hypothetical protein
MGTTYECKRCGFSSEYKCVLKRHLQRKILCEPTKENIDASILLHDIDRDKDTQRIFTCKFCDKKYTTSTNRYRHQKQCKQKDNAMSNDDTIIQLKSELNNLHEKIRTLEQTASHGSCVTNNIQHQSNIAQQNVHIIVNSFGHESYDHITDDFLNECFKKHLFGVHDLIKKIHFSEEAIQNKNVRIKSLKNKLIEVADNHRWVIKDLNEATDIMIKQGGGLLKNYYFNSEMYKIDLEDIDALNEHLERFWTTVIDKDSEQYYTLRRRILALILEHSEDYE